MPNKNEIRDKHIIYSTRDHKLVAHKLNFLKKIIITNLRKDIGLYTRILTLLHKIIKNNIKQDTSTKDELKIQKIDEAGEESNFYLILISSTKDK